MESWREELYHHGILGMKWGVRRYQNADGSLTAAGKDRYRDPNYAKRTTKKQRRSMTTSELKARAERLQLEKRVKDLEKDTTSTGKSVVEDVLKSSGKKVATQLLTASAIAAIGAGLTYAINKGVTDKKGFVIPGMQNTNKIIETLKSIKSTIPSAKNQW